MSSATRFCLLTTLTQTTLPPRLLLAHAVHRSLTLLIPSSAPAQLTEAPSGGAFFEAVAILEGSIAWDRVREDALEFERQIAALSAQQPQVQQPQQQQPQMQQQQPQQPSFMGGPLAPALHDGKRVVDMTASGGAAAALKMRVPHRVGAGKRPRALVTTSSAPQRNASAASGGSAAGGDGSGNGGTYDGLSGQDVRARALLLEMCARGEAEWEHVLTEAAVPTREQLLSGPSTERVPAAALRMLALLESAGVGGRHEGAVVTQLLELVHRHAASLLADAVDCCLHRTDAHEHTTTVPEAAQLSAQDVRMAVEMDVVVLTQAAPPPREFLVNSGCCAINALPLPMLPDSGLGVVLPRRADCLASLYR